MLDARGAEEPLIDSEAELRCRLRHLPAESKHLSLLQRDLTVAGTKLLALPREPSHDVAAEWRIVGDHRQEGSIEPGEGVQRVCTEGRFEYVLRLLCSSLITYTHAR